MSTAVTHHNRSASLHQPAFPGRPDTTPRRGLLPRLMRLGALAVVWLVPLAPSGLAHATTFTVQAVTATGSDSEAPVIAVAPAGGMHVAYERDSNIYHATRVSGVWSSVKVNPAGTTGHSPSLAVNAAGELTMVYIDGDARVRVAGSTDGAWSTMPVTVGSGALSASLVLDAEGDPQIVVEAANATGVQIFHLAPGTGGWDVTQLTSTSLEDRVPSIAIDSSGGLHIAYRENDGDDTEIWYAANTSGTWVKTRLTDDIVDEDLPSIALDSLDVVHIAYERSGSSGTAGVYVASRISGSWQHVNASAGLNGGSRPAAVADPDGHVHVVFQLLSGGDQIHYATDAGGSWSSIELSPTTSDEHLSWVDRPFTIDRDGFAHVVFQAVTGGIEQVYHAQSDTVVTGGAGDGTCDRPLQIACGQRVNGDTAAFSSNIDSYSCTGWDESGPEAIYGFTIPQGSISNVVASLDGLSGDLDVYLIGANGCASGQCLPDSSVSNNVASVSGLGPGSYLVSVDGYQGATSPYRLTLQCTTTTGSCTPNQTTMCLNGSRFRVTAHYRTQTGESGYGRAVPMTGDTGYFWFFDESNVELVVKVLRGCGVNGKYWVFAAGLTNVEVTLTVEDVITQQQRTYTNELGASFLPVQDTSAFDICG